MGYVTSRTYDLSIIITTYNRAVLLTETLKSLINTDMAGLYCEIIVIDNNSSDATPDVVKEFARRYENIKVACERAQGLSYARNKGLDIAKGDIIAFLDDDLEVNESWPKEIVKPFIDSSVWCVTGKVKPYGNVNVPEWLPPKLSFLLSISDYGSQETVLSDKQKPIGCNMAFKNTVFSYAGRFDPVLGRKGNTLLGSEEVLLYYKILKSNKKVIYNPNAVVFHKIDNKLTKDYVLNNAYWSGFSESYIERKLFKPKYLAKLARSALYMLAYPGMVLLQKLIQQPEAKSFMRRYLVRYSAGYLKFF